MVWPEWEVFEVREDKPYRKAFASCRNITNDMLECYEKSSCVKSGQSLKSCMKSEDADWVGEDCIHLKKGYAFCKRSLLNPMRRLRPALYD
jgi:cytochrome c oxidase assembly factor 5